MTPDPLLIVKDLKVYFDTDQGMAKAVDGVSFRVGQGETVCLVGESGCGKTVSALSILGLLPQPPAQIAGGKVFFKGRDLLELEQKDLREVRGREISMVFQEPMTSLNPVFTIGHQIEEVITTHEGVDQIESRQRIIRLLNDVGIASPEERMQDYPHNLSGGQRQRVMIAMALACSPELIIADEPTTALDVTIQAQILNLFKELQEDRGMAILQITHDLSVVAGVADRIYVMYAGIMVEEGSVWQIFREPCHPYTMGLLESLPGRRAKGQDLATIPGAVPDPANKPPGCPFHPRCRYVQESCRVQFPEMCDFSDRHLARCPIMYAKRKVQSA
ncbi:MAG: ABC transporter ATP-binding protein [Deltaproteobacteria bacterium]|nr:MAG: ABC transporter ATP-binding protein [Deltaproteobacteria bacterium]